MDKILLKSFFHKYEKKLTSNNISKVLWHCNSFSYASIGAVVILVKSTTTGVSSGNHKGFSTTGP